MTTPPTARLIARVGHALWGDRWQTEMARALGVADRTVRRWAAGQNEPPPGVWRDLRSITRKHVVALIMIERELDPLSGP